MQRMIHNNDQLLTFDMGRDIPCAMMKYEIARRYHL